MTCKCHQMRGRCVKRSSPGHKTMVKRRSHKTHRRVMRGKPGFKKCVLSTMRSTKFKTAKQARKAFSKASKKCNKKLAMKAKKGKKVAHKRHCKYGHRKGSKKCRKTPRR